MSRSEKLKRIELATHLIDLYVIGCLEEDQMLREVAFTRLLNMRILTIDELLALITMVNKWEV